MCKKILKCICQAAFSPWLRRYRLVSGKRNKKASEASGLHEFVQEALVQEAPFQASHFRINNSISSW